MFVKDVMDIMEELAPPALAEHWDNVGLLVGDENGRADKILFALDAVDAVIDEAIETGADMIVTHHPLIFKGTNTVTASTALGRRIIKLVKNDIALYSAHTNLDIAEGGTNSVLAGLLGLKDTTGLIQADNAFIGKVGSLETPLSLGKLAKKLMSVLDAPSVNITGDPQKSVKCVGLCTGSGADRDFMLAAKHHGCDVYITGDVGYHSAQFAEDNGLCLIDASHYYTEAVTMPRVCDYVRQKCSADCFVTKIKGESFSLMTR